MIPNGWPGWWIRRRVRPAIKKEQQFHDGYQCARKRSAEAKLSGDPRRIASAQNAERINKQLWLGQREALELLILAGPP